MAHIRLDKHGDDDDYNKILVNNDRLYHSQIAVAHVRLAVRPADRIIVVRAGFGAFCGRAVNRLANNGNHKVKESFEGILKKKQSKIPMH